MTLIILAILGTLHQQFPTELFPQQTPKGRVAHHSAPYRRSITPTSTHVPTALSGRSFARSKELLGNKIFTGDMRHDIYCGCSYVGKVIDLASCKGQIQAASDAARLKRMEWEHVVPASWYGHDMACWKSGGRKQCGKDATFEDFEGDMHNLRPSVGEMNGRRSNWPYGYVKQRQAKFGGCDFTVGLDDHGQTVAEPPDYSKGDVARATFYIADKYHINLSAEARAMFKAWDQLDPVDDWERQVNTRIAAAQGDSNPYIK